MRTVLLSMLIAALSATAHADCRHPNGNIQTDAYHAPCADALNDPLNTMCCAIERSNPSGGLSKNGLAADVCLPNGLCKQSWKDDEDSVLQTHYYREECTVAGWKDGKCLSVCLSVSASSNVRMTPCDDTANSTRWCCGDNKDCCAGDIGFESLAQTFLGDIGSATSASSSMTVSASSSTAFASSSTSSTSGTSTSDTSISSTSAPQAEETSTSLSGGAIAGIVVGAIAGIALIGAAWFLLARRRRRSDDPAPPVYVEEGYPTDAQKISYAHVAHEADGTDSQVAEVSAANVKDHDGRSRVHELQ